MNGLASICNFTEVRVHLAKNFIAANAWLEFKL